MNDLESRTLGSLWGLAIGDALGMPTQDLSLEVIRDDYGKIDALLPAGSQQKIAAGAPAGMVTDDTEQALILARLLAERGRIEAREFCGQMLAWEESMIARGSLDLLGPSTKRALLDIRKGISPAEVGKTGTTNGAAMRVAPVGVATSSQPLEKLVTAVRNASEITHNTSVALAGASAVAGVVSAAIDGASKKEAIAYGLAAAAAATKYGNPVTAPDIAKRAEWAIPYLDQSEEKEETLFHIIGTSMESHESVVAALAITALEISDWEAVCLAASAGGDTDTIAAMVGTMRGALAGIATWPAAVIEKISAQNNLDFSELAAKLLAQRNS